MITSTLLLFLLSFTLFSARAERVYLLNTLSATSELNWKTYSNKDEKDGWLEETIFSNTENVNHQVYSMCNLEHENIESWLLMPKINTLDANEIFLEFAFTIIACDDMPKPRVNCKETLTVYAHSSNSNLIKNWYNTTKWDYVDTLVAKTKGTNIKISPYMVNTPYVYFAVKNTGACSSILHVKVRFFKEINGYFKVYYNYYTTTTTTTTTQRPRPITTPKKFLPIEITKDTNSISDHKIEENFFETKNLIETQLGWPWILLFGISILFLCCILLIVTRYSSINAKQMSDLDALDKYKEDTITPDYSRSLSGYPALYPGYKPKINAPLISTYGTHRSINRMRHPNGQFKPKQYINPNMYEDPDQALADFTNEILPQNVSVTRVIGGGEFGEVCCGRLTVEDQYGQQQQHVVAVKTLRANTTHKEKSDFLKEASIMGQFDHENVIHLLGVVTKTEPVMIVTEYMLNGSLDSFLRTLANNGNENTGISQINILEMLHGIANGMKYLTDKSFVHRDLAARNVLVDDRLTCKIADFGLSRWMTESLGEQEYLTKNGGKIPIRWTAPEAINYHRYTAASDVWSFGVVMWEVCSFGDRPYWDWSNHKVMQDVSQGYRLPCPPNTPAELYQLMLGCWQADRHSRPTFSQILISLKIILNELNMFYRQASFRNS